MAKPRYRAPVLIDTQTQAAPELLAFLDLALGLVQRTDLEHIGIVPAFLQGGVGKMNRSLLSKDSGVSLSCMIRL